MKNPLPSHSSSATAAAAQRETARGDEKSRSQLAILSRIQTHSSGTRVRHMLMDQQPSKQHRAGDLDRAREKLARQSRTSHAGRGPRRGRAH